MSLCIILCRAGFGINVSILKTIKLQVLKLSCLPVMIEAISFSVVNKFILNMPFEWSFLLGYISHHIS
jgi:NhaP-type Na+/H+ or K+/H+ antiporter